jgi:nuclear-control-of-ATPase protein 2
MLLPPSKPIQASNSSYLAPLRRVQSSATFVLRFANLPLELTRQECRYNPKALERLRDERAEVVGRLAQLRSPMSNLVRSSSHSITTNEKRSSEHETVLASLAEVILPHAVPNPSLLVPIQQLALWLPGLRQQHLTELKKHRLLRPSVLTRIWPSVLVFPPLALYIYTSRTSWVPALMDMAADARETVRGFVQGWLVEPLVGVINTVRGGGKGDMLVREEGVLADLEVNT